MRSPTVEELAWRTGFDTGISSQTIWHVMTGVPWMTAAFRPDMPHDPDDFGRCYRLLARFPEWRARLREVANAYPEWEGLVDNWDELERIYLRDLPTGRSNELYERIQNLRRIAA